MAKLDNGWVFVSGEAAVRPASALHALPYLRPDEAEPSRVLVKSPKLLWRNAGWVQSIRDLKSPTPPDSSSPVSPLVPTKFQHLNEQRKFSEMAQSVRQTVSLLEISAFLDQYPVEDIIESIPQSLPLLEAIYSKFYLCDRGDLPRDLLKPQRLLSQLLWWTAHQESAQQTQNGDQTQLSAVRSGRSEPAFHWRSMMPHIRNLIRIVNTASPGAVESLRKEQQRLEQALEGLGLHGLVNCGKSKLIEATDAVRLELSAHYQSIKLLSHQLDKMVQKDPKVEHPMTMFLYSINGGGSAPVPSKSSHQRLMSLRLSDIRYRLHLNEFTLQILQGALHNSDLNSLERILHKRITLDKDIMTQFNALLRDPNPSFALASEDPMVSQVLVHFKSAYQKLLSLLPVPVESPMNLLPREDSGFGEEDEETSQHSADSSQKGVVEERQIVPVGQPIITRSSRLLGPVANLIRARSKRFSFHRSLVDFAKTGRARSVVSETTTNLVAAADLTALQKQSRSLQDLENIRANESEETETVMYYQGGGVLNLGRNEERELRQLREDVCRLNANLLRANRRIRHLTEEKWSKSNLSSDLSASYNGVHDEGSVVEDESAPVHRYSRLFAEDRPEILAELSRLPGLQDAEDLHIKIIFTVVVLGFRSVEDVLETRKKKVWEALEIAGNNSETRDLEAGVFRYLRQQARHDSGMQNAKSVTAQIWKALYDFPALKTCTRFNRFILECVDVAWDLCAGVDGRAPRYRLDYDSGDFSADRHLRFHSSSLRSAHIKRYVWPGLRRLGPGDSAVIFKAVVIT